MSTNAPPRKILENDDMGNLPVAEWIGYVPGTAGATAVAAGTTDMVVEDAIPLTNASMRPENADYITYLATLKGRQLSQQEIDDIRRANQRVRAVQSGHQWIVDQANRKAAYMNRMEELGYSNPIEYHATTRPDSSEFPDRNRKPPPEFYMGTYGKDYEVEEYDIEDYDTNDYDIPEYKSVYET